MGREPGGPARRGDTRPAATAGGGDVDGGPPLALRLDDGREVLLESTVTIGKADDNVVVLDDDFVSAWHCAVERAGRRWLVVDRGSRNGTFVGGARVERGELRAGVRISVGNTTLRVVATSPMSSEPLVGRSAPMRRLRGEILRVAPTRASVLLLGESGTGKELAARAIHVESGRRGQFVALNCGAIAAGVVESELFGHERGAFTGATARRPGVFEEADGGTLLLDEIGELPLDLQPKLLRALETGSVRAVGAGGERAVDVRVVAATHRDLHAAMAAQRFRVDLFHRLATIEVHLPPLRERREDIPALVNHFLDELSDEVGRKSLAPDVLEALSRHAWPGNVRELRNALQRGAILGGAVLTAEDLLPGGTREAAATEAAAGMTEGAAATAATTTATGLKEMERAMIERALEQCGGNQRAAAALLGLPKSTLSDKVKRFGLRVRRGDE